MGQLIKINSKEADLVRDFAVSRLSDEWLASAYELLVPIARRAWSAERTNIVRIERDGDEATHLRKKRA